MSPKRSADGEERTPVLFRSERPKAFLDAAVAIAMTLLILPLMESVSNIASQGLGAAEWLEQHNGQIITFVLSFALIALFWFNHHRLFAGVERVSAVLLWLMMAWLLLIVWFPVVTAMTGQMSDKDALVKTLYIGTMIATSLMALGHRLYLRAHPGLHDIDAVLLLRGMTVDIATVVLFALALTLSLVFPVLSYFSLFVMFLTGPLQSLFERMLSGRSGPDNEKRATR